MKNRELPESLAKQGISRHIKENYNNDKNIIHLPRQHLQKPNGRVYIKRPSKKARDF